MVLAHVFAKTGCLRVESRWQMEETQPEPTSPDSQTSAVSTMPGSWKFPALSHASHLFPLKKKEKEKKSQSSMMLSGLSLSISLYVSEEE